MYFSDARSRHYRSMLTLHLTTGSTNGTALLPRSSTTSRWLTRSPGGFRTIICGRGSRSDCVNRSPNCSLRRL
jgi:hypothetical protein